MSLINKMLQDLESRKNPQADSAQKKPVYEDLKPLSRIPSSRASSSRRIITLLAAVGVVGASAYGWMQWGDGLVSSLFPEQIAAKSPPPVARKAPPPKPVPATVPAPAPVAEVKPAPAPATAAGKTAEPPVKVALTPAPAAPIVAVEPKKPVVAPIPVAPKPAPAKSKSAREAGYWTVSRGDTLYGISAQTGIDLWHLSSWNNLGREHVIYPGQRLRLTAPAAASAKADTRPAKQEMKTSSAEKPKAPAVAAEAASKAPQDANAMMDKKVRPLSADEKAEGEYRRAADLLQKGRMADAEKHLRLALNASESYTPARELLAGVMLQQGHWREAQQLLEQGIEKVPTHYPFAQLLARVYVEHGADQKALAVMQGSRRAAADNPEYVAFLATLYQRAGMHAEAVKTYNEAVTLNPQEGRSWLGLGISLEAVQDRSAAGAAYQRAIGSGTLDDNLLRYARQRLAIVNSK